MGIATPKALQNAVFFTVGKMFSLRGGVELRKVKTSQIKRETNSDRYTYIENVSKTNNGTFKQLHIHKVVPLFRCPELESKGRCPVQILDLYFNKLPPDAFENDIFFYHPLEKAPSDPVAPCASRKKIPLMRS